ncbi:MAG: hypothetical protein ACI35P_14985 [Bacillus sp. (in: firmicutes)]
MKEIFIKGYTITLYGVPPTFIMDCIHNDEHLLNWSSTHVETVYDSEMKDIPIRIGLKYISRQKIGKKVIDVPCEVTEYIENKLVNVKSYTKEGISYSRYTIEKNEDETLLTLDGSFIPSNWFQAIKIKLSLPFATLFFKDELERLEDYIYRYLDPHHSEDEDEEDDNN